MSREQTSVKLTILVTVYNEVNTVKKAIMDVQSLDVDKEIIVVDNCSTDGTHDVLRELDNGAITVIYQDRNYGYGKSVETGLRLAKGRYMFVQFSDLEYDFTRCLEMLELAEQQNCDAVFGSRCKITDKSKWRLLQERPSYLASFISTFLVNKWYKRRFTDVIGLKFYKVSSAQRIRISTRGMGFDFEHVSRMCKAGFHIGEVHVGYEPRSAKQGKKIKAYHMINALWALLKVKFFEQVSDFLVEGDGTP